MESITLPGMSRQARRRPVATPPRETISIDPPRQSPHHKGREKQSTPNRIFVLRRWLRPLLWISMVLTLSSMFASRLPAYSFSFGVEPINPFRVSRRTGEVSKVSSDTGSSAKGGDKSANRLVALKRTEEASKVSSDTTDPTLLDGVDNQTLALLYPPGLFGGYRNQVIRFVAFVEYAMQNGYKEILLPSLIWKTETNNASWLPVPHEMLFDVPHWNSLVNKFHLPRLVPYNKHVHTDWSVPQNTTHESPLVSALLKGGFTKPLATHTENVTRTDTIHESRYMDLLPNTSDCRHPAVYGGGSFAGHLWWDNMELHRQAERNNHGQLPFNADVKVLKALVPKQEFRDLAMECVANGIGHDEKQISPLPYVALHARVELDMMGHKCGRNMEKNLTKIFDMVNGLVNDLKDKNSIKGVFVAISRSGMEINKGNTYRKYQALANENLETLNRVLSVETAEGKGLRGGLAPSVFVCGQNAVQNYNDKHSASPNFGTLLESMVDFYVATQATAFVGVRGSSYSTDIWTTRYHLGKGDTNYEYTPRGIQLMENGGLPPPHKQC